MCPSTVLFAKRANLIQLLCIHCILCVLHRPWPSLVCVATAFIYRTLLKLKLKSTTMLYRYWCVCKLWLYEVFTFLTVRTYVRVYVRMHYVCTCMHPCTVDQFWRNSLMYWFTSSGQSCCTQWLLLGMRLHKRHTKGTQKMHNVSHTTVHMYTVYNIQYCTYSKVYNA